MCGIMAYIGHRDAYPVLIKGLKRLEYRGYDSAGIALMNGDLHVFKRQGKVTELEKLMAEATTSEAKQARAGIGHTRWATHGVPNDVNAHPHRSGNQRLAIIHNGIIENYASLKQELIKRGHTFESDTDTEVLVHFIEDIRSHEECSLEEAVRLALTQVVGAYAIAVLDEDSPDQLVAARKGSPLVIGVGKGEFFLASDASPIVEYTNEVIYLNDHEIASIKGGKLSIRNLDDETTTPYVQTLDLELEEIEKGGYEHFMLKEIFEQPNSVRNAMRGRVSSERGHLVLGGLREYLNRMVNADRILIVGCGTSWHAGLVAEYIFEDLARIPVEVEYASEFRYRNPVIREGDVVIAISQSGETADTLAAIELAKERGAIIFGVCNVVGSSIARLTHEGAYTHAGPEIGVASTKAFTSQVTVLAMMALMVAKERGMIRDRKFHEILAELEALPDKIERALKLEDQIKEIAAEIKDVRNALFLGRGYNFPVALEGALKLKEISYIHAEGYPAAEMKHGPIALIDAEMPVFFIATRDGSYEKIISNIREVKARQGRVIAIVTEGDTDIRRMADHVLEVPAAHDALVPIISVVPLQLLSYHVA
ncbi:MAG: glutamine--fructose-6-phosphate transaminase (isomerizing), partial [Catalinimonas sp.]